jgi:hypothetical protein
MNRAPYCKVSGTYQTGSRLIIPNPLCVPCTRIAHQIFSGNLGLLRGDGMPTSQAQSAPGDIDHPKITGGMGISQHFCKTHRLGIRKGRFTGTIWQRCPEGLFSPVVMDASRFRNCAFAERNRIESAR